MSRCCALVAGLATFLAASAAGAHHPGGGDAEGGPGWLWLFLGVVLLLAGIAAWAFLSGEPREADQAEDDRGDRG